MNVKVEKNDLSIILTACIKPENIPFLERSSEHERLEDYKKSFNLWCENDHVKKLIFIENSGYDLNYLEIKSKEYKNKNIEIISINLNNTFDKNLGKGYGEYLCLRSILEKSRLFNEGNYFLKVTGRYYLKNYKNLYKEIIKKKLDVGVYLKDNLKYADSHVFTGSNFFLENFVIPETSKTNDTKGIYFENCLAKATLKGINSNLKFGHLETYPDIYGIIGTNNKKIKNNLIKRIKLFFIGKIKNYLLGNKRY